MIKFDAKTKIFISDVLSEDVFDILKEEQSKRILILADEHIADSEEIKKLIKLLEGKIPVYFHRLKSIEPTTDIVNEYTAKFKKDNFDMFIGIGGGSTIDLTKALSVMVVNEGKVEEYHGTGKQFTKGIKKLMIPSTAGTGSEVTPGAVLVNQTTKFKRSIGGKYVVPDYAVLNAKLTMSMPDGITASTGMDALGHAIESFTAKCSNIITKMYSKQAFSLVFNNLNKTFNEKENHSIRQNILLGSCLAGFAIYNSNTGAAHSISYAMGIYHNIPHGVAIAHLLPKVVKVNVGKKCDLYSELYDLIEGVDKLSSRTVKAEKFVSILEDYLPLEFLKSKISDYGINTNNYEFLAERGLDLTPALSNNPVEFGLNDSKWVIKELITRKE